MSTDYRALCAELVIALKSWSPRGGAPLEGWYEIEQEADLIARTEAALETQPEPVAPTTPSEWHLLSLEQPSVNALCEYICHTNNWGVIQGKGKWYEQTNPTVSGFTYSHGLFVSNPTQTLWRLSQPEPVAPKPVAPTDEEIMELMPQQMRDDLAQAARALAGFTGPNAATACRIILNRHALDYARAVLAKWGQP
jgi:hypothetical protein